ncbi:MAG: hypothetical protein ACFNYM_06715 [Bacteroidota bacterium]|jgi:hypothetical protein
MVEIDIYKPIDKEEPWMSLLNFVFYADNVHKILADWIQTE